MIKATVKIDRIYNADDPSGKRVIEAKFEFSCAQWYESHPYGSTTASEYMAEAICNHIYVDGMDIDAEELVKITGGAFDDSDATWEALENSALESM